MKKLIMLKNIYYLGDLIEFKPIYMHNEVNKKTYIGTVIGFDNEHIYPHIQWHTKEKEDLPEYLIPIPPFDTQIKVIQSKYKQY